jgi:hypothetical protein
MGPTTSVGATALGGALGTIAVWVISELGLTVPDTVGAAIATVFAIVLGWLVPPSLWSRSKEGA